MKYITLSVLVLAIFLGQSQALTCHLRELDLCAATLLVFTQNPSGATGTDAEIDRSCTFIREAQECRMNFTNKCTTPLQRDLIDFLSKGAQKTADEFCTPGTQLREDYKKHAQCLGNARSLQKSCNRDLQAALEVVTTTTWNFRVRAACCAFNRFDDCTSGIILQECGKGALDLSRKVVRLSFSRLPEIVCKAYPASGQECTQLLPPLGTPPAGRSNSLISRIFSTYVGSN